MGSLPAHALLAIRSEAVLRCDLPHCLATWLEKLLLVCIDRAGEKKGGVTACGTAPLAHLVLAMA